MTLARKYMVATELVAVAVLIYVGYLFFGSLPSVHGVKGTHGHRATRVHAQL